MKRNRPPPLLPHQAAGVRFLRRRKSAALFDDPGLGKSKQLIEAVGEAVSAGEVAGALIVCPNILKATWEEEIGRHSQQRYAIFGAGRRARRISFSDLRAVFYVINYEAIAAEMPALRALLKFKRLALVLDESHRIKTPTARVTRALQDLKGHAARRYIMTGTPVANRPEDIWSQIHFLDDGAALGETFDGFKARYLQGDTYRDLDGLRARIQPFFIRRQKGSAIRLPPKKISRISIALKGRQHEMYETLCSELELWVRSLTGQQVLKVADLILVKLLRLVQIASNPNLLDAAYDEVPVKFDALDKLLDKKLASPREKVIVWSSFVDNLRQLAARYEGYGSTLLHGELDARQRAESIARFKRDARTRVLLANPAAAREGLTLTVARTAVYVDRTFNLVDFLQSQERIHRISQTRPCEVVVFVARNTVDELVDASLAQKQRVAAFVQGDVNKVATADLSFRKPELLQALAGRGRRSEKLH